MEYANLLEQILPDTLPEGGACDSHAVVLWWSCDVLSCESHAVSCDIWLCVIVTNCTPQWSLISWMESCWPTLFELLTSSSYPEASLDCQLSADGYNHHFIVFLTFYAGLYKLSVEILQNLAKVPRFGMIAMFLSPKEKQGESQSSVLQHWGLRL